ncbi:MAG: MFS transporter [Leptospiraceae bacterium]|nr:MFS transporter [Leptospiraceae bacterium]MDW7976275.1 MFS transporter [Leptospiraceae bacterium]
MNFLFPVSVYSLKEVYFLTFVRTLLAFGYTMANMFIPLYLLEKHQLSVGIVGTISSLSMLFGLVGWLFAGTLIKRFNEKFLITRSLFLRSMNYLTIGVLILIHAPYYFFFPFLFLNHFLLGITISPMESLILTSSEEEKRHIAVSIHRVGMNIGWSLGPLVGGFFVETHYALPFFGTFLIVLICAFLILWGLPEPKQVKHEITYNFINLFRNRKFLFFSLNSLNLFIMMSLLITPLAMYLTNHFQISKVDLGKLYFLNGVMVVILQIPISVKIKNLPLASQLGLFLYFVGFSLVGGYSPDWGFPFLILCIVIVTLGELLGVSPVYAIASIYAKEKNHQENITNFYASSFMGFMRSLGWSIGPLIAGWIQEFFSSSPLTIWLLSSSFALMGMIINQILFFYYPLRFKHTDS